MPSLTRVPITCAAAKITAARTLPSARLAPNRASAISTGQMAAEPPAMKADSTSEATGWCSRFATLVLAQAARACRSRDGRTASMAVTARKAARKTDAVRYRRRITRPSFRIRIATTRW